MVTTRRKAAGGHEGTSKKAKKDVPAKKKAQLKRREDESPPPTQGDDDEEKHEVQWAQPTQGQENHHRDQGEAITKFSQTLFNQPWAEIWTAQRPFKFPALRTPLYKSKSGVDLTAEKQPNTSTSLRQLFNRIKNTTQENDDEEERVFTGHAFRQVFSDTKNVAAVVASASTASPILALDHDYRVDVTVGEGDAAETAHVLFLRRIPAVDEAEATENDYGYFIELPPNTRITVNGMTYINDALEAEQGPGITPPFIVGPLNRYTIIELLSQPIFFFRTQADLEFTAKIKDNLANRPSGAEMSRRHQLDEDAAQQVEIIYTPLHERRKSSKDARSRHSATPNVGLEYDDTWVADTDVHHYVEDALHSVYRDRYRYLIARVLSSINDRQEVEAGFSIDSGEEVQRPGRTLITTIQHPSGNHIVLLIYRVGEDRSIRLHVLDAMAWSTTAADRQSIHENARQLLVDRAWWRGIFESAEEMQLQFPETSYWVDCAQQKIPRHADACAVVNAFAIAMGLQLNIDFHTVRRQYFFDQAQLMFDLLLSDQLDWKVLYAFFTSTLYASRVVALDDDAQHDDDDDERDALPPPTRRFDLRVRPYDELVSRQRAQDSAAPGMRSAADIALASDHMKLHVGNGFGHNTEFPYDGFDPEYRNTTLCEVAIDGGWKLQTSLDVVEEWYREGGLASPPPAEEEGTQPGAGCNEDPSTNEDPPANPKPSLPPLQLDYFDVSEKFSPCDYFRNGIAKLLASATIKATSADPLAAQALGSQVASLHILQVLRAMNEVFPVGQGFSFYDPEKKMLMTSLVDKLGDGGDNSPAPIDLKAYHDRVVLSPRRIGDHRVLLLLQFTLNKTNSAVVIHVLDSAVGRLSKAQRQEVFDSINRMRDSDPVIPRSIMWVFGPQQEAAWQVDYFTVLNAWSTLLGLNLNRSFSLEGKPNFFTDVKRLLQASAAGHADWKLIWAFLRCSDYVVGTEPPPMDRRFTRTVSMTDLRRYRKVLDGRKAPPPLFEDPACLHPNLDEADGVRHDCDFPQDERVDGSGEDIIKPPEGLHKGRAGPALPAGFEACTYFNRMIQEVAPLDENSLEGSAAEDEETQEQLDQRLGLNREAVFDSIAIVAAATNYLRPDGGGTAVLAPVDSASDDTTSSHDLDSSDRVVLIPWSSGRHTVVVVVQYHGEEGQPGTVSIDVVDSAPWTLREDRREEILHDIGAILSDQKWHVETPLPTNMTWILGPQQVNPWQSSYFAILSSWAILLGCTLNYNYKAPPDSQDHFERALRLIRVVQADRADWRLIYSFLRCIGYIEGDRDPDVTRRFQARATRDIGPEIDIGSIGTYDIFEQASGEVKKGHDEDSFRSTDEYDDEDVYTRIPHLLRHGEFNAGQNRSNLREKYADSLKMPRRSKQTIPQDLSSCRYLNQRLAELREDLEAVQLIGQLQVQKDAYGVPEVTSSHNAGVWLHDREVALAIASVTLAITAVQDVEGGLSAVGPEQIRNAVQIDRRMFYDVLEYALRFGRPLIFPITWETSEVAGHTVLVILQMGESDSPEISIVDSKAGYWDQSVRDTIFDAVLRLMRDSHWWRHIVMDYDSIKLPESASWIPCAQQPKDSECGYYSILNGWALALGLELNVHAAPNWNTSFFEAVLELSYYVRTGLADWTLLYAFLRCHRLVHEGEVPRDRRFTRTVALRNESDGFASAVLGPLLGEIEYWNSRNFSEDDIRGQNRIYLPPGRNHTADEEFIESVRTDEEEEHASELAKVGRLQPAMSDDDLLMYYDHYFGAGASRKGHGSLVGRRRGEVFLADLNLRERRLDELTRDQLLSLYLDFVVNKAYDSSAQRLFMERPCSLADEGRSLFSTLLGNPWVNAQLERVFPEEGNHFLEHWEVNIAIAAVVEAIDKRQLQRHQNTENTLPFSGGFALSTSLDFQLARESLEEENDGSIRSGVSRPRRCWVLPFTYTAWDVRLHKHRHDEQKPAFDAKLANMGHTFLVLVMERARAPTTQDPRTSEFVVRHWDSSAHRTNDPEVADYVMHSMRKVARKLGWSGQRNDAVSPERPIEFVPNLVGGLTAQQPRGHKMGSWMCGHHTILNAWILAMGLHPRPNPAASLYNDGTFYEELWMLIRASVAGLLDWKTLVAWFFCKNLTTQRGFQYVPMDRRFVATQFQDGQPWPNPHQEAGLADRVRATRDIEDTGLATHSIDEAPYDHTSNVVATGTKPATKTKALLRSFDDLDLEMQWTQGGGAGTHLFRDDGLQFLDEYDDDGDVNMTNASTHLPRSLRYVKTPLTFLHGY